MGKDSYIYPAILDYADDGISIEFPDLPGCFSCADTDEEALFMAKDALRGWLMVAEDSKMLIDLPTPLKNINLEKNQKAILVEANLAFYREAYKNRSIKKTLTIPAWLNDLAEKEKINFSFVLQSALKEHLNILK